MSLLDFRSVHMPYCLQRQKDGSYVVLNREYKPLGFKSREFFEYKDYPIAVKFKSLTKSKAKKLWHNGSENLEEIFLYNDGCIPERSAKNMKAYLDKLALLAKLEFKRD